MLWIACDESDNTIVSEEVIEFTQTNLLARLSKVLEIPIEKLEKTESVQLTRKQLIELFPETSIADIEFPFPLDLNLMDCRAECPTGTFAGIACDPRLEGACNCDCIGLPSSELSTIDFVPSRTIPCGTSTRFNVGVKYKCGQCEDEHGNVLPCNLTPFNLRTGRISCECLTETCLLEKSVSNRGRIDKYFYDDERRLNRIELKDENTNFLEEYCFLDYDNSLLTSINGRQEFPGRDTKVEFEYNSLNMLVEVRVYNTEIGTNNFELEWKVRTTSYDLFRQPLKQEIYTPPFNAPNAEATYEFDSKGNISQTVVKLLDETGLVDETRITTYRYDDKKVIPLRICTDMFFYASSLEAYSGQKNNLLSRITEQFDENDELINTSEFEYSYEYNEEGYPIKRSGGLGGGTREFTYVDCE